jgi:hypothetical protein
MSLIFFKKSYFRFLHFALTLKYFFFLNFFLFFRNFFINKVSSILSIQGTITNFFYLLNVNFFIRFFQFKNSLIFLPFKTFNSNLISPFYTKNFFFNLSKNLYFSIFKGYSFGFANIIRLKGVGYKLHLKNRFIYFRLGHSH